MSAEYTALTARLFTLCSVAAADSEKNGRGFPAIIAGVLHAMSSPRPRTNAESDLLSDEPTIELVVRARTGDRQAVEALLQRSVPQLKRWAHGRLPPAARNNLDTGDLVQETVLHVLRRLDTFQPRHVGAMQAYLRQSVINRIRDEVRRIGRHPALDASFPQDMASDEPSPEEQAVKAEAVSRYHEALGDAQLPRSTDWSLPGSKRNGPTTRSPRTSRCRRPDAARMAVAPRAASSDGLGEEKRLSPAPI